MENTNTKRSPLKAVSDGAACGAGKMFEGVGYCAGRAAPTVRKMTKAVTETKAAKFVYEHYRKGFVAGEGDAIEAQARRQARKWLATGEAGLKEFAEGLLADIAQWKAAKAARA